MLLLLYTHAADMVLSGSEDGTVREVDVRVKPPPLNRTQELQPASEDYNVLGALQAASNDCWCTVVDLQRLQGIACRVSSD